MSIKESAATALVRFTGLGIICFNKERQRGEIGVIRDNKHTLTVRIQKPVFQDGVDNDIVVYQDVASYENLPKDDVQIEIKAASAPEIEGYEIYQSGDFNRLESEDFNDFRWIVNINNLHGEKSLVRPAAERYPLTKLYVGNGLFYTHQLDRNLFFEKVEKDASGAVKQSEAFGYVAETIGVKIEAEEVNFIIRIGGKEETHSLKRVEGFPFRIEIKNMDYSTTAVYSDMPDYYRYMSSSSGVRFDLSPVIEGGGDQRVKGGTINQDDFCHPLGGDFASIDEL